MPPLLGCLKAPAGAVWTATQLSVLDGLNPARNVGFAGVAEAKTSSGALQSPKPALRGLPQPFALALRPPFCLSEQTSAPPHN